MQLFNLMMKTNSDVIPNNKKMKNLIILLVISLFVSCSNSKEKLITELLTETISNIKYSYFFLYYPPSPFENIENKYPRLDLVFNIKFREENDQMLNIFQNFIKIDSSSINWVYLSENDKVPLMNYDTLRTYHFVDADTITLSFEEYADKLAKERNFGFYFFLNH